MASTSIAFDIIARDLASSNLHQVGRAADNSARPLSNMSRNLKRVGIAAGIAAGAGAVFAVKWGVGAVKAAMADEQAQVQLARQIRNNTDARAKDIKGVEKWIDKLSLASGVADDELRPAMSKLVTVTGDVGKAQDLTRLAMDVSAGRQKSLTSVTDALAKAQLGQMTGLSKLGVQTKDVDGKTLSLKEITQNLADLYGGAAKDKAETFAGKMDRLKVKYDETKEAIGAKLLPKLTELATWFLDEGIPALEDFGDTFRTKVIPKAKELGSWIKDHGKPALEGFREFLDEDLNPALRETADAFGDAKRDAKPFFDLLDSFGMGDEASDWKKWLDVLIPADETLRGLGLAAKFAGKQLGVIGQAAIVAWNEGLQPMFKLAAQGVSVFLGGLADIFKALGSIPGAPKWIKATGKALDDAADKARRVADEIRDIPTRKDITIAYHYTGSQQGGLGSGEVPLGSGGGRPGGAQPRQSGRTVNGQQGRMMSGSTDAMSIAQALRTVLDGARLQIVPGTSDQFYLLTGTGL